MLCLQRGVLAYFKRAYSTPEFKKSVFISQSKDIYTNLAFEDWLYRNFDFTNHHVLMLWQNEPCVVIGRHQNPWLEANISELNSISNEVVKFARRNSGGGTVFHDLGNINMTFFTSRNNYKRKRNLEVITRAVFREYGVELEITSREDLTLRSCKVSGTAAKLGRPSAYHHCTLLVNSNKLHLSRALQKNDMGIQTNATKSIKSKIINLSDENPKISISKLFEIIGWEYLQTQDFCSEKRVVWKNEDFQIINPTEEHFPGVQAIKDHFQSWEWCFGKTPKFTLARTFNMPHTNSLDNLEVKIIVEHGKITQVNFSTCGFADKVNVIGHKFSEEVLDHLEWTVGNLIKDKYIFVTECVGQVMCRTQLEQKDLVYKFTAS